MLPFIHHSSHGFVISLVRLTLDYAFKAANKSQLHDTTLDAIDAQSQGCLGNI